MGTDVLQLVPVLGRGGISLLEGLRFEVWRLRLEGFGGWRLEVWRLEFCFLFLCELF